MWTDGSANEHTNFATDSRLEGGHCCIKAGFYGWRGGLCNALLHGVCESDVADVLAHPDMLTVEGGRGMLAIRWGKSDKGWIPSKWVVRCCFLRFLDGSDSKKIGCVTETLQSKAVGVIFKKLEPFAEYNVSVSSHLEFFNKTDASTKIGRTCKWLGLLK